MSYHDSDTSNNGGQYRPTGVDVRAASAGSNGMVVFNAFAGEWLEYTVNVASFGVYDLSVKAASRNEGGTFHIEMDGVNLTGSLRIAATGGWQTFQPVGKRGVTLPPGIHVLRLALDSNGVDGIVADFDAIGLTPALSTPGLVSSAYAMATNLANLSNPSSAQIAPLVTSLEQAYASFLAESNYLSSAGNIDKGLRAALYFARAAYALGEVQVSSSMVQGRLLVSASYLNHVNTLMVTGSNAVAQADSTAHASALAVSSPVIGPADTRSSATFAPVLTSGSLGTILGDATQSPLSTLTTAATQTVNGQLPYELSGVSVMVGGRAAEVLSVSPSQVSFLVPSGLPVGEAEVIVTLQAGYVSRGTVMVAALAPGIFTRTGNGTGEAVAFNSNAFMTGPFDVTASTTSAQDKRTRLILFTTGITGSVNNYDVSNDLSLSGAAMPNLAESIGVEARTSDGRIFNLTVEYAGSQGACPGLDQVNIVLPSELRGAGAVELTVITGSLRSNTALVTIK